MTDPMVVDAGLYGLATRMTNDLTAKIIAELDKATLTYDASATGLTFDAIVDAIAKFPHEDAEDGLFLLINRADLAGLRKNLKDELKYVEAFARTGYIGSVCGVPVYVSDAVPAKKAFLATKEAVTVFTKKGSETEQERDANIRKNTVYARKVMLVALTDATRVVEIATAK
jgi:HK97 family phage major capsid protein